MRKKLLLLLTNLLILANITGHNEILPFLYLKNKNGDIIEIPFTNGTLTILDSLIFIGTSQNSYEFDYDEIEKFWFKDKSHLLLSNLTVSEGSLIPEFNSNIFHYTVEVPYNTSSIIITATAYNENVTIIGNGIKELAAGENNFTIAVTDESGETSVNYYVTVIRAYGHIFQFEVTVPANGTFAIPLSGYLNGTWNKSYNWNINWGDGQQQTIANTQNGAPQNTEDSPGIPHTYSDAGTYTISITPAGATDAWLAAFGFYRSEIGANAQENKDMVTKVISPLTPLMTRTQAQINTGSAPLTYEWAYTFFECTNLKMGNNFNFSNEWNSITTVGYNFANQMFFGCSGYSFTMNEVFNLPSGITTVGGGFAIQMFARCSGYSFTMNEVFNLPNGITTVGHNFAIQMFANCRGYSFTMNEVFNLPSEITTVGNSFAANIFSGCYGANFTMNEVFNLPRRITNVGNIFAYGMFRDCLGANFTMNEVFNLPNEITTVGDSFAENLFVNCLGAAFTMNEIFNLPSGISDVGNYFASLMFYNCSGANFTMNEIFNLPSGITIVGDYFAHYMFSLCSGSSFKVNDIFKFPILTESEINKENVFYGTFRNLGSASPQTRTATSIINGNPVPNSNRETFINSNCFADLEYVPVNWGGSGQISPPVITTTSPLLNGTVGAFYNITLTAIGTAPINWSIVSSSGNLPQGIYINETSGVISGTPTNVGTFNFTVKAENLYGYDTKGFSITIIKGTPTYTIPTGLTATFGDFLSGVILPPQWEWETPSDYAGNAGVQTHNAIFTPEDVENYNIITEVVSITVNKANPEYEIPTNLTATYGDLLSSVILPPRWEWETQSDYVGNAGVQTHNAIFIPEDVENYNIITETVSITVNKANPEYEIPTNLTATYGDLLSSVILPPHWEWENPNEVIDNIGTLMYKAKFTPTDIDNYNVITNIDVPIEVSRAPIYGNISISGNTDLGDNLTVETELIQPFGATYSYQWYRNSIVISGATNETYTIVQLDIDKTLSVEVSGTENYTGSLFATIEIQLIAVTDITNVPTTAIIGTPLELTGSVVPINASFKNINWSVGSVGTTGAVIVGNTLYVTTEGTAMIMATIKDGKAIGVDFEKGFFIEAINVGISTSSISNVKIYPNPTNGKFTVHFSEGFNDIKFISIRNMQGQIIEEKTISDEFTDFNIKEYSSGVYFLIITNKSGQSITMKLVKQ